MRKLIAAINMTLDGFCDRTAGLPTKRYVNIIQNYWVRERESFKKVQKILNEKFKKYSFDKII